MQIRAAKPSDEPQLTALIREFEQDTQTVLPPEQAEFRRLKDTVSNASSTAHKYLSDRKFTLYVAEEGGQLRGYISGYIKDLPHRVTHKEGYVQDWFMSEGHRTSGTGKRLFDRLVDYFRSQGCTHILLDTHVSNARAQAIYEHMGMTKRTVSFFKLL